MRAIAKKNAKAHDPAGASQSAITQHLGLVYHVARSLSRARSISIELDDLVSAGTLGLIDALANFDVSRGLAFTTFAAPRIRGAMLDELRRLDHVPRSVRRRARTLNAASDALAGELGTLPNERQLAERLGIDSVTLRRWRIDSNSAQRLQLDTPHASTLATESLSAPPPDVHEQLTREQELIALQGAIRALGKRERAVLSLYYYEELRLHQIGEILGVSESRVSQIRTQAIARLRELLARFRDEESPAPSPAGRRALTPRRLPRAGAPPAA